MTARGSETARACKAFLDTLPRQARVAAVHDGDRLTINATEIRVKWIGKGWLTDVRRALDEAGADRADVFVAEAMSPGAQNALAEAGIGWVDETGGAEVVVGPIVVARSGRRASQTRVPDHWTPSVLAVAEAVLCHVKATVDTLAEATSLSNGSAGNALRYLTKLGLLEADTRRGPRSGRRVADHNRLLEAYAAAAAETAEPLSIEVGVTWRDPVTGLGWAGEKWEAAGRAWAATSAVAASLLAPYMSNVTTFDVYVDANTIPGLQAAAADAGLDPIQGGRLKLRPFPTPTTQRLSVKSQGVRLAPWPRVYADLRTVGVRGEEAAEHLREIMLGG